MGRRNNKLCDQKGHDPKEVRQAKKPTKRNLAVGQKAHFKGLLPILKQLTFLDLFNIYNFFVKLLNNDRE